MRPFLVLVAVSCLGFQIGCATAPKKGGPVVNEEIQKKVLAIHKVGVSPKSFWPEKGETVTLRWTQSDTAATSLEIYHESGKWVRRLEGFYFSGDHQAAWDGKDESGNPVATGVYLYTLRSQNEKGDVALYEPSSETGGEELKVERFTFDKERGAFDFVMPRAGRARLRIGLSPFMHLRTLMDWETLEGGAHTVIWDGLDSSGTIRAIDHPNLSINLAAFSLPDNAILVKGNKEQSQSLENSSSKKPQGNYLHALHDRADCRDIALRIEFPDAKKNEEGLPILGENTLVRLYLEDQDKNFMVNQRFEVMFFVDTVSLFEEEDGQDPFNFIWDTKGLSPGEHLLTVNVIGYDDHYGVKTVRVMKQ